MKITLIAFSLLLIVGGGFALGYWQGRVGGGMQIAPAANAAEQGSFFDFETNTLLGEPTSLSEYAGRVCLVVNVASKCGLTPQYAGLEAMQVELGGDDFTVLGFPSNDFLNQEPGTPGEIAEFCSKTYGVTFPMFEKMSVTGEEKNEIYQFLCTDLEEPTWNFTKYLVGRDGSVLYRFAPKTEPDNTELRAKIQEAIGG
jgi:glutathione peroxidase